MMDWEQMLRGAGGNGHATQAAAPDPGMPPPPPPAGQGMPVAPPAGVMPQAGMVPSPAIPQANRTTLAAGLLALAGAAVGSFLTYKWLKTQRKRR